MKKVFSVILLPLFIVSCSSSPQNNPVNETVKPIATAKTVTTKEVASTGAQLKKIDNKQSVAKSGKPQSGKSNIKNTALKKKIYTCAEVGESMAYSLLKSGHSYLDRDGDGHPCEWGKKKVVSKPKTSSYKSNCHRVGGYYRKSGTYVRGYMRCR